MYILLLLQRFEFRPQFRILCRETVDLHVLLVLGVDGALLGLADIAREFLDCLVLFACLGFEHRKILLAELKLSFEVPDVLLLGLALLDELAVLGL